MEGQMYRRMGKRKEWLMEGEKEGWQSGQKEERKEG